MLDLPLGLKHALESRDCVLFLGAGIGRHLIKEDGSSAPTGPMLAEELVDKFSIDTKEVSNLTKIATVVELRKGRAELEAYLRGRLEGVKPDKDLMWLFTRKWKAIYTTNYDNGIERGYELLSNPVQRPVSISYTPQIIPIDPRFDIPIYHLHGALFGVEKPNIVITEHDYVTFKSRRKMLFELLKHDFATSNILYIGYKNEDSNWALILSELTTEFYPRPLPPSYRIAPDTDPLDVEILASKNITTIEATYQEFANSAAMILAESVIIDDSLHSLENSIHPDIKSAFDKNPIPVARLLSSWTYVNGAPFNISSNLQSFLRGDLPNWGLIGLKQVFERDIEEDIYSQLLDYATSESKSPTALTLLGSAGYGVTTLLMTLAARLVAEKAGKVFMLKPGNRFIEGDGEFALSLFNERTFIFIDNAADWSEQLNSLIHRLKETGRTAMFVLGARLNEWRQAYKTPSSIEYQLEPLSDSEIYRLLDYLEQNSALNVLEKLNKEMRFSVIKKVHKKELLVALRETTEGKSFDAIIEDEYRGIANELSKRLYSLVCCSYQYGIYVRNELLAKLLNVSLLQLYENTEASTEGVIFYECISQASQLYAARARHRTIAAIVWERCVNAAEQEQIIQSSLNELNLNYGPDKDAFENFIKSDRLVDGISTLEGRIRFFDTACNKDPKSPYVRQHYARMLLRDGKADLALGEIEKGIALDGSAKILLHTKGVILMSLALKTDNLDIARKRVAQSEACFKSVLAVNRRDEYSYQSLAQLYLGWAKRAETDAEAVDYVSKSESIISEGLKHVTVRDGLWIESANIQQWLGDEPTRLKALETAVKVSPGSIIARYLLGKAYRIAGKYTQAIEALDPVINNYHEEFRAFVEYSIALAHIQKSYGEAIAVLRISSLYGLSDPRYIATLGGMEFMNNNFSDAKKTFDEVYKRPFSNKYANTIEFRPINFQSSNEPLRLIGKVVTVKAQSATIDSAGYPPIVCPSSKFGGLILEKGLKISFELAFSARGALADTPKIAD